MTRTYRFAGVNIGITSVYEGVHHLCRDYVSADDPPVFVIQTTQTDIDFERERSAREDELEGVPVRPFCDEYLETLAVYRKIAERMPSFDTILFHGSCVAVDGEGYLFAAESGTGKSTHTRLWRELLGKQAVMINDDKPLIHISERGAIIYGTPWDGKHHLSMNTSVPLKAVCILERAEKNGIRRINTFEALPMLLQQTYRPADEESMQKTLTLIDRLADSVNLWKLSCNMDIEAARVAYNAMKGN